MNQLPGAALLDNPVANQYERWVYPVPMDDLSQVPFERPSWHYRDLRDFAWGYWPGGPPGDDLDILVAGCGSMAAACYAYFYPKARVVGIDISGASLASTDRLRRKHDLANLTLHQLPVERAGELKRDFDFIACHGVLHHTPEPVAGLRGLGGVLRRDGVIALMLYAPYGRTGVYMLQELFRLMQLQQDEAGVQTVRDVLGLLGPRHPVQVYLRMAADDLASPPGLVDTFLHRLDRPFSAADCVSLVESAGLTFQGWDENIFYYPDAQLPAHHPVRAQLDRLSGPALWHAMELMYGYLPGHFFHACRTDRPVATYRIPFGEPAFLDCIPQARVSQTRPADPIQGRPAGIARAPFPEVLLTDQQARVYAQIDGRRSIRACLQAAGLDPDAAANREFAHTFFTSLWRVGYMLFKLPTAA